MKVTIANNLDKTREITWQDEFPKTTKCCRCKGRARLGFVVYENSSDKNYLCNLYNNEPDGDGYWLHDACCVAVYFCKKCLEPTALYNQG